MGCSAQYREMNAFFREHLHGAILNKEAMLQVRDHATENSDASFFAGLIQRGCVRETLCDFQEYPMKRRKIASRTRPTSRKKASTQDVIGSAQSTFRVPPRWKEHHQNLIQLRDSLHKRRSGLARDVIEEHPNYSLHMADAATDHFDRDFALSVLSSEQNALFEIDQALMQIHVGTYGVCELTGKKIEAERLRAIPWTRYSAQAERKLEREGALDKTALSPRQALPRASASSPDEDLEE